MKEAVLDIETTDLAGVGSGIVLCACVRPIGSGQTKTFRIDSYKYRSTFLSYLFPVQKSYGFFEREERALLLAILSELKGYDLLIGHNIDGFDLNFLKTRAYRRGIDWRLYPFTYDTMKAMRRTGYRTRLNKVGKPSAGLAMVSDLLGIKQTKTSIYPVEWWESVWGNDFERTKAMNEIVSHCQGDVWSNAEVYPLLLSVDMRANIKRLL